MTPDQLAIVVPFAKDPEQLKFRKRMMVAQTLAQQVLGEIDQPSSDWQRHIAWVISDIVSQHLYRDMLPADLQTISDTLLGLCKSLSAIEAIEKLPNRSHFELLTGKPEWPCV